MPATHPRGIDAYRATSVNTSSPLELVVMLYDGSLRFATEAREAIVAGDIRRRGEATSRLIAIVGELQRTLNIDHGGEIASRLDGLYGFVLARVLDASVQRDVTPLDEATKVLTTLRSAWKELAEVQAGAR